ncbi:type II toxin-antitoxin system RelB family antitoxin [Dolosigranulum pigrum]|nr:DUF6290 family protein [Dolosigranulum pigrum]QTJ43069.1 translation repressor RelB [Dolosigranulum pigrum]QTJ46472.1 translation repressor RelB [Dolosigranulum pigrum]QTJ59995.1 translation repressor RelB [Dolosigranulum pigrum]
MTIVSVRLNKEEEKAINSYATLTGQPVSQLLKQALLREIEDKVDYTIGVEALEEHEKDLQTFTIDEVAG